MSYVRSQKSKIFQITFFGIGTIVAFIFQENFPEYVRQ